MCTRMHLQKSWYLSKICNLGFAYNSFKPYKIHLFKNCPLQGRAGRTNLRLQRQICVARWFKITRPTYQDLGVVEINQCSSEVIKHPKIRLNIFIARYFVFKGIRLIIKVKDCLYLQPIYGKIRWRLSVLGQSQNESKCNDLNRPA